MSQEQMANQMRSGKGFVAALDQSGGSTPKALGLYGVGADQYGSDAEMFDLIHAMRSRIATSPAFDGNRVVGAILFEMTMERDIEGKPSAQYLWEERGVVPFLKIDKGLEDEANGARLMKPIPGLSETLERAKAKGVFGTKMRSVIDAANPAGIKANVAQQFDIAREVLAHNMVPIIEPEVTITISDKAEAEDILRDEIAAQLDALPEGAEVMLKLSPPTNANQYADLIAHPKIMRVVALSGGYSREEANRLLSQNNGMIASFSRGLAEGLSAQQSDAEFSATLDQSIQSIYDASLT